jgi:O-antigen/teichoic acid export membrane protein
MRSRAIIIFASSVMQRLSVMALTILASRMLGSDEFGRFAIIYATCINLTLFVGDGLAATANRYMPLLAEQEPEGLHRTVGSIVSAAVAVAVLLAVAVAVSAPVLNQVMSKEIDLQALIHISSFIVLGLIPNTVMNAVLHSVGMNKAAALAALLTALTVLGGGLWGASIGGAYGMCVGFLGGTLIGTACYASLVFRRFGLSVLSPTLAAGFVKSEMFSKFAVPTVATMAMGGPVHWYCLSILSSSPAGLHGVAVFSAFFQWYSLVTFLPAALNNFTIPWLAAHSGTDAFRKKALLIIGVNVAIALCLLLFAYIGQDYVVGLYGPDFAGGGNVLVLLAACGVFAVLAAVMNQVAWAGGRSWRNLVVVLVYSSLYVLGAFVFVKLYGLGAAGLAWAILGAGIVQGIIQIALVFGPDRCADSRAVTP